MKNTKNNKTTSSALSTKTGISKYNSSPNYRTTTRVAPTNKMSSSPIIPSTSSLVIPAQAGISKYHLTPNSSSITTYSSAIPTTPSVIPSEGNEARNLFKSNLMKMKSLNNNTTSSSPNNGATTRVAPTSKTTSSSVISNLVRNLFKFIFSLFSLKTKDYKLKTNFGFTLVELIVVIVILGILATIAFLSFSNQSGSARDGVRISDINSVSKSMEMYNLTNSKYPLPSGTLTTVTYSGGILFTQGTLGDSVIRVIKMISKKPLDPLSSSEYMYSVNSTQTKYQIKADFEDKVGFDYNDSSNDSNGSRVVMDYDSSNNSIISSSNDSSNGKYISSFLSFFSSESNLSTNNHAYADTTTNNGTSCYIKGNYNGVMEKTSTGTSTVTNYIVALPGIITSATGTNIDYNTIGSGKLLCTGMNNPCSITFTPTVAYSGTSLPSSDTEINAMMVKLQNAYTGSNIKNIEVIDTLLKSSGSTLTDLGKISIKSVGGSVVTPTTPTTPTCTNGTIWNGTACISDPDSTVLLLHGDNTDNPTTFIDFSTGAKSITPTGDVKQIGPKVGNGFGVFDGNSSYLIVNDNSSFNFGTGDFIIETWVNLKNVSGLKVIATNTVAGEYGGWNLLINAGKISFGASNLSDASWNIILSNSTLLTNTWYNIKVTRIGTSLSIYLNNVLDKTGTMSENISKTANLKIGDDPGNTGRSLNGYLDDLKITKAGSNILYLKFDTDGTTFTDETSKNITKSGNPYQITSKFGGMMAFDGNGDYLTTGLSSDWNFGTGAFTIDTWSYVLGSSSTNVSPNINAIIHTNNTTNYLGLYGEYPTNGVSYMTSINGSLTIGTNVSGRNNWKHYVLERNNGTLYMFENGILTKTGSMSSSLDYSSNGFRVGAEMWGNYYYGYIDELRIIKGKAVWDGSSCSIGSQCFTPSTSPY